MSERLKAHLALLAVAIIYGANYVIAKNVLVDGFLSAEGFIFWRVAGGSILFWIFHKAFVKERIDKADYGYLAICGLLGVAINQMYFFKGLKETSAIHAALIMVVSPILVLVIGAFSGLEKLNWQKILGICLGAFGAVYLILSGHDGSQQSSSLLGDVYILINALSYAFYLVLVRKMINKYSPITVVLWVFGFGWIFVTPFSALDAWTADYGSFTPMVWWSVVYVVLFTTFMTYLLNAYALSRVMPSTVSIYIYLQPLIASFLAVYLQNEKIQASHLISASFIFLGVYLASKKAKK